MNGYVPQRWSSWFRPKFTPFQPAKLGPFQQSFQLTKAGDVMVVPTPGHTNNHQSVIARDGNMSYFLADDARYAERAMLETRTEGVSPDEKVAQDTLKRIRDFARQHATVYLPAHDPKAKERLEGRQTVPTDGEPILSTPMQKM